MSIECQCETESTDPWDYFNRHWTEDKYGADVRLDCGCPCPTCEEY